MQIDYDPYDPDHPWSLNNVWFNKASDLEDHGMIGKAIRCYRIAARMGHVPAQNNLATLLDDKVKPSRPKEAVYWYKRAVRTGYATAAWNLAMHYRNLEMPRWYHHWLQVAARMGDDDAIEELRALKK